MFRRALTLLAVLALLLVPGQPAWADRGDEWRARALDALAALEALPDSAQAFPIAYQLGATAMLHGWDDPRVEPLLDRLYDVRNADGGWGLGYAYDFGGDGSTNPASTTYTVTLAGHVGPTLLAGYKAGKVPKADIQTLVNLLMSTPRINYETARGACLAYSRHANDNLTWACVHNVNAGAGHFLQEAAGAGVTATGMQKLIADITRREAYAYQPTISGRDAWWRYADTSALNDADHNSYEAASMYHLAYGIGREPVYQHMADEWTDNAAAPIAHMRLTSMPGGPGSMSGSTTRWCVMGDQWFGEYDAFVASNSGSQVRLAQAAYYAARNSLAC
jgi:hypothetical protein